MTRRHLEVIVDLTSRCNIRCVMCHFSSTDQLRFKPFDLGPRSTGYIELEVFRHLASELFRRTHTVGLGCSAEPLLHPNFSETLRIAREHRVPKLSVQTNLLALSEAKARAIVEHEVHTVSVSIDGTTRETYEHIRSGASWDRLHSRLELLRRTRLSSARTRPRLRITFAWMRSNRGELRSLPAFASSVGAREIDVRFVVPTVGVDNRDEVLDDADPKELMDMLWNVARDATSRGIRLGAYPAMEKEPDADNSVIGKIRRKLWLLRSGIDGPEQWRRSMRERIAGCSFPGRLLLIRPNGAVLPCPFWEDEPIALLPRDGHRAILRSQDLEQIRTGLRVGCPVRSCRSCTLRKDALFRPLKTTSEGLAKPG
jgi:MoaA/NifB/PqqE/SkfB family radical SAM enzyme